MTKKYLTARQLGISASERKYLIRAADILINMSHAQEVKIPKDGMYKFDMSREQYFYKECGTDGCILGLCVLLANTDKSRFYPKGINNFDYTDSLSRLFYPSDEHLSPSLRNPNGNSYQNITPKIAARAAYGYLKTKKIKFTKRKSS